MSEDFQAFLSSESISPPAIVHERLQAVVARDLNPRVAAITAKVAGLHLVAALISLAICPQFGIGPFGGDAGLMAFLMNWGWVACAAGCGAVFMIGTGLLSGLFLAPDEKRVLARHSAWIFTSLSSASWAAFMMAMGTGADAGHGAHHLVVGLSPEAFSNAWSAVWVATATLSALGAFTLLNRRWTGLSRSIGKV